MGELIYARSTTYDYITYSIIEKLSHVTEAIAERASLPDCTPDTIKLVSVDVYKDNDTNTNMLVLIGVFQYEKEFIRLNGKIPMSVVLQQDKSKVHDYFESIRREKMFEKAMMTDDTVTH